MKDEIKEKFYSLEELKRTIDCYDGYSDNEEVYYFIGALRFAYNYITNLQKEVNIITAESTEWESKCYDLQEENEKLKRENYILKEYEDKKLNDYKSRIEKAIEYIKKYQENKKTFKLHDLRLNSNELLNILNGDDE